MQQIILKTIPPYDQPGSLLKRTRQLLDRDPRPLLLIANTTGLPYFWLRKFKEGRGAASVNRVQFLFEKLASKPLSFR